MLQPLDTYTGQHVHRVSRCRWACSTELCIYSSPQLLGSLRVFTKKEALCPWLRPLWEDVLSAYWVPILPIPVAFPISPEKPSSSHFIQYCRNHLSECIVFPWGGIHYTHWMVWYLSWEPDSLHFVSYKQHPEDTILLAPASPEPVCQPVPSFALPPRHTKAFYAASLLSSDFCSLPLSQS